MGSSPEEDTALWQLLQQIFTHWVGWCFAVGFPSVLELQLVPRAEMQLIS
jgi:hypothetical protein